MYVLDSLAFLLIISMAVASKTKSVGLGIPMILRTIVADATRYFLVIFSAHVAFEMTLNIGQVSKSDPPCGSESLTSNACLSRECYNSFQARKSSLTLTRPASLYVP